MLIERVPTYSVDPLLPSLGTERKLARVVGRGRKRREVVDKDLSYLDGIHRCQIEHETTEKLISPCCIDTLYTEEGQM